MLSNKYFFLRPDFLSVKRTFKLLERTPNQGSILYLAGVVLWIWAENDDSGLNGNTRTSP